MGLASFKNPILNEEIEVSTDSSRGQAKALPNSNSGRRPILKDRTSDRIAGAELIDFHNSIVT
jgi:hypothetical protein